MIFEYSKAVPIILIFLTQHAVNITMNKITIKLSRGHFLRAWVAISEYRNA